MGGATLPRAKVGEVMVVAADLVIEGDRSVREAAIKMDRMGCGCLFVAQESKVVGIVTEKDLVRRVLTGGADPGRIRVADIMSYPIISVEPDTSVDDALQIMAGNGLRRLPVIHEGRLLGVVTIDRLAVAMAGQRQLYEELLKAILEASKPPESSYIG